MEGVKVISSVRTMIIEEFHHSMELDLIQVTNLNMQMIQSDSIVT
jgi:hypothetical protein